MTGERRTALVTGSARRVGRILAAGLVDRGWQVVVHARDADRAQQAAQELGAIGSVDADLSEPEACGELARAALGILGDRLDLLVNSASSFVRARPGEITPAHLREAFRVNMAAPLLLAQALLPALEAAGGLVVNISDHAAHEHWPAYAAHAASKAALESLTVSCARAWAPRVRVNCIAPGLILPPDDWDARRVAEADAAGELGSPDQLLAAILALADAPTRSGELLTA